MSETVSRNKGRPGPVAGPAWMASTQSTKTGRMVMRSRSFRRHLYLDCATCGTASKRVVMARSGVLNPSMNAHREARTRTLRMHTLRMHKGSGIANSRHNGQLYSCKQAPSASVGHASDLVALGGEPLEDGDLELLPLRRLLHQLLRRPPAAAASLLLPVHRRR
eukprot:1483874-Rhodomonas_salina.1